MMGKRSHAPVFWALFGAGGMLAALTGPALVFLLGLALPLGFLPASAFDFATMSAFVGHPLVSLFLFGVISLYAWHAAHRIYKSLHDVGIPPGTLAASLCYGTALAATLLAAYGAMLAGR